MHENNPDQITFNVRANDIPTSKDPLSIAKSIVYLAKSVIIQDCSVTTLGIIPRNDPWNNNVRGVNYILARMCQNDNISPINHSRSNDPRKTINTRKLHLNIKASNKLRDNFLRYLKVFSS